MTLTDDARIAILDRGLSAVRLIQAVRELNRERGSRLRTVALFVEADRDSFPVREADASVGLGVSAPGIDAIEAGLATAGAAAAWAGWDPLAPLADIEALCARTGIELLGFPPEPVDAVAIAQEVGFGSVEIEDPDRLRLFDVPVISDGSGGVWSLGVVDRTLAPVPVSPPASLAPWDASDLEAAASRGARAVGTRGIATASFALRSDSEKPSFVGWRPGLGSGLEVVEATTGLDIVKLVLEIALGNKLDDERPVALGCSLNVHVEAADPDAGFAPRSGAIELLRTPAGPGLRVDVAAREGDVVDALRGSPQTVASITAWGRDRPEAFSRLTRALHDTAIVVGGGTSTRPFLLSLLARPEVKSSDYDAAWLDDLVARREHVAHHLGEVALIQAAVDAHDAATDIEEGGFYASALRGRPRVREEMGRTVELRHRGQTYRLVVYRTGARDYLIVAGDRAVDVQLDRLSRTESILRALGGRYRVLALVEGRDHLIEVEGALHRVTRDDLGIIRSSVPAVVVSIPVTSGARVEKGQPVAIVEAMKMEMTIGAPFAGTVREILVEPNTQVPVGTPLVRLDPDDRTEPTEGDPITFAAPDVRSAELSGGPAERCLRALDGMRRVLLGYDAPPERVDRLVPAYVEASQEATEAIRAAEQEILRLFADVCALSRGQPLSDDETGEQTRSPQEHLLAYLRSLDATNPSLSFSFVRNVRRAVGHHEVPDLRRTRDLERAMFRIFKSLTRMPDHIGFVTAILEGRLASDAPRPDPSFRNALDRLIWATQRRFPTVTDTAREVRYRYFDQPLFEATRDRVYADAQQKIEHLAAHPEDPDRAAVIAALMDCPQPLKRRLTALLPDSTDAMRAPVLEVLTRRYYRIRDLRDVETRRASICTARYEHEGSQILLVTSFAQMTEIAEALARVAPVVGEAAPTEDVVVELYVWGPETSTEPDETARRLQRELEAAPWPRSVRRAVIAISSPQPSAAATEHFTFRPFNGGFEEERLYRGLHPMMGKRLGLRRLEHFVVERLPSVEDVYVFHAVARENPKDERLFVLAEVRDLTAVRDDDGRLLELPHLERMLTESLQSIRLYQSRRPPGRRLHWNRVLLYVWPPMNLSFEELFEVVHRLAPATEGLGLEQVEVRLKAPDPEGGGTHETVLHISSPTGRGLALSFEEPDDDPIAPLTEYQQKVVKMRQRGLTYPYEIVRMLTPTSDGMPGVLPPGRFTEYDLDDDGRLVPIDRPVGENRANIVVGVISNHTNAYPEGMKRVILLGDPSKALGSLAEPECHRINAALDLAEKEGIPLEWFAVSAGAKISMESGTENMDWIGAVLKRLVEFTQSGGEVNVVVCGINVGAQPYWNAEATMLMHTRGLLIMTADGAMVLTGKQALDFSGGVSAEDNFGIGGYDRVMGPNGQAQYWAADIGDACRILLRHYDHTYVAPGERFPRRVETSDPFDRDVRDFPHRSDAATTFRTVGEVFSETSNPDRKKPFDIRSVMRSTIDQDHAPLERWAGMRDAEIAVVWDAHVGGFPICLLGIESKPLARQGFVPADGPERWTSGTLFPMASKKIARAINAASRNRPLVVMANLSGFDGSPESMRLLQLEYGAEIGRAVVNFDGPMVFCVISRYHGGAFVVFSAALNDRLEVAAVEGSYASVIGGAPAAAAVFARAIDSRTKEDPRIVEMEKRIAASDPAGRALLRAELDALTRAVRSEKLGEAAREFDNVHTIQRAQRVGSVHRIIPPEGLRPYLIDALERGVRRA